MAAPMIPRPMNPMRGWLLDIEMIGAEGLTADFPGTARPAEQAAKDKFVEETLILDPEAVAPNHGIAHGANHRRLYRHGDFYVAEHLAVDGKFNFAFHGQSRQANVDHNRPTQSRPRRSFDLGEEVGVESFSAASLFSHWS